MFPYKVKYTESEYDLQNKNLLYKEDQQCQTTLDILEFVENKCLFLILHKLHSSYLITFVILGFFYFYIFIYILYIHVPWYYRGVVVSMVKTRAAPPHTPLPWRLPWADTAAPSTRPILKACICAWASAPLRRSPSAHLLN